MKNDSAKDGLIRGRIPGDNWAFMERKLIRVPDLAGKWVDHLYRITILRTPMFSIKLHKILGSDLDRYLHDHPWHYVSLILSGVYQEERQHETGIRRPGNLLFRHATSIHRLTLLTPHVWTLFITSGRIRTWGFYTETGWKAHYAVNDGVVIQLP